MDIQTFDKKIVKNYLETLIRYDINTIPINIYIRKPYIEKYIIENPNIKIKTNLKDIVENNELYMYIYDNITLNQNEKKLIQNYFINNNDLIEIILLFVQNYFYYYMMMSELLYEDQEDLYDDIYIYINNDLTSISKRIDTNFNFQLFYYYTDKLYKEYEIMLSLLIKKSLLKGYNKDEIKKMFIKNLFSNWYLIFKKNGVSKNIKENKKPKKRFLSRLLCIENIN